MPHYQHFFCRGLFLEDNALYFNSISHEKNFFFFFSFLVCTSTVYLFSGFVNLGETYFQTDVNIWM